MDLSKDNKPEELISEKRNFNKYLCFSNIRELIKNSHVKIGQIEKEAGCQPGYMSRLDKQTNSSEPSIEFIVTAANMLGVSLDTLITLDLASMTPTERYLAQFFDKLKKDTLDDKLEWIRETADSLNNMVSDENGYIPHPLFRWESYSMGMDEATRITFVSDSFGKNTYINGDCFSLKLKNQSILYLMDICEQEHPFINIDTQAKEIWMYMPSVGAEKLVANNDNSPLSPLVDILVETVSERMSHPRVKKDLKYVIDAFMKDDLEDDEEKLPFSY
ncbi:hypothetical protein P261_02595 [Lachnospiraceae bacterium TWA4]|nr:hypothetical protein P261_02595 [Lachnospiraceae bacterium TWA4]